MVMHTNIINRFIDDCIILECVPYGNGHINDTYKVVIKKNEQITRFILQRMNTSIFKYPEQLMQNIVGVTQWIEHELIASGYNDKRGTLKFLKTMEDGSDFFRDSEGSCWRMCYFVENAYALEKVRTNEDFYQSAIAFGKFQQFLRNYPAKSLHETIPDFHNTVKRLANLRKAVENDIAGRVKIVQPEISEIYSRANLCYELINLRDSGELPVRVTHNDTKLNNVMIDSETNEGICVIDLDTVMPGLAAYDFGDAIRFGANTSAEDETNLNLVSLNLELFEIYVKGFVEGCNGSLTDKEIETLPLGAMTMTLENAIRFLTDYLEGDHYFKIHRPNHNLDRCRCQLALLMDMENKSDLMQQIVENYKV